MGKIKIAVFLHGLSGGAGQVVINYFSHMKERSKYEIDIVTLYVETEQLKQKYENNGMKVIQIPSKKESILKNMLAMYRIFKSKKYDIVYGHMTLTNCFPFFVAKLCGVNVRISHSHLVTTQNIPNKLLAKATQILSTEYLACGVDAGKSLYGKKKFKVFNNAIDLKQFKFDEAKRQSIRQSNGIEEDDFVIGHIGRFDPQKNHRQLIKIFKAVVEKTEDAKLLLIGEGELFKEISYLVKEYGLEKKVIFTGGVSNVADYIQAMDVFVLPSLYEGLCLAAIEVQGNGVPCVFSNTVSPETKKLKNVSFVKLDEDPKCWAKEILRMKEVVRDNKSIEILKKHGYDIDIEAQKLDKCLQKNLDGAKKY